MLGSAKRTVRHITYSAAGIDPKEYMPAPLGLANWAGRCGRKRLELLDATEEDLREIQARVRRAKRPLRGQDKIGLKVGAVINNHKMEKHFDVTITDNDLTFERKMEDIDAERVLDGIYVLRTNLDAAVLDRVVMAVAAKAIDEQSKLFTQESATDLEITFPLFELILDRYHTGLDTFSSASEADEVIAARSS
jgi:hypothetical protein